MKHRVHPQREIENLKRKSPTILQRCLFNQPVPIRTPDRPGRNQPCPCQSGIKFKKCCKTVPALVDKLKEYLGEE